MDTLTKKEAYFRVGLNGSLKGSKGQKEEKEFDRRCRYEKTGKGPGVRYLLHEIYETPIARIHGNTGNVPVNKGTVDENSLKFSLATAISQVGVKNCYLSKTKYLKQLNLQSKNLKNIGTLLGKKNYHELDTIDKLVFKEVENMQLSLSRLWSEAIELLSNAKVKGVTVHEQLHIAHKDASHDEAIDIHTNPNELKQLYDMAEEQAKAIVKEKYGDSLFFPIRMKLTAKEYENLRDSKQEYQLLSVYEVNYFYNKYAIDGTYPNISEDYKAEFIERFIAHRKELSYKNINKQMKFITGDFLNENIMRDVVDQLFVLLFEDDSLKDFKVKYADMVAQAKKANNKGLDKTVAEAMIDFPTKLNN